MTSAKSMVAKECQRFIRMVTLGEIIFNWSSQGWFKRSNWVEGMVRFYYLTICLNENRMNQMIQFVS